MGKQENGGFRLSRKPGNQEKEERRVARNSRKDTTVENRESDEETDPIRQVLKSSILGFLLQLRLPISCPFVCFVGELAPAYFAAGTGTGAGLATGAA